MNTNSYRTAAASVIGARHRRAERNGQDAVYVRVEGDLAVAVVCDGCSSGAASEVGARLGARWFAEAIAGCELAAFEAARASVVAQLERLVSANGVIEAGLVKDLALFTIVCAVIAPDGAAVYALGDGAYAIDGVTRVLGPFPDNEPPYLAYDLLGHPATAHYEAFARPARIAIATDGIEDLDGDFGVFGAVTAHPDALRRKLVQLARADERIDWDARRVVKTPARLQDDLAIAVVEVL